MAIPYDLPSWSLGFSAARLKLVDSAEANLNNSSFLIQTSRVKTSIVRVSFQYTELSIIYRSRSVKNSLDLWLKLRQVDEKSRLSRTSTSKHLDDRSLWISRSKTPT